MNKWRPRFYQNPYPNDILKFIEYERLFDEILDTLKAEGIRISLPKGYNYDSSTLRAFCEHLAERSGYKGWLIWIDDGESQINGVLIGGGELV